MDAALNTSLHPTQRRLVIALVVSLACLPLLVLDLMGGKGGGPSEATMVETNVPEPSLVVAVSPSEESTTTTSEAPASTTTVTEAPVVTTAAPTTVAAKPKATTTTTVAAPKPAPSTTTTTAAPVVAVAPAPPSGPVPSGSESAFLACVRHRESRGIYTAVDPSGQFMGAYQIYQGGWDAVARSIGRGDLVGVAPHTASPADQDAVALAMLRQYGTKPWGGACG